MNSEIIKFLFGCLDKYGKEASVLFSFINFENQSIEVVNRLLKNYSDVFDFNMINSTLLKTTSQLTSELNKLKLEFANTLTQMKKLFEDQRKDLENITAIQVNKDKNDDIVREERQKSFDNELNEMKAERERQKSTFDKSLNEMKEKQEEVIKNRHYFKIS